MKLGLKTGIVGAVAAATLGSIAPPAQATTENDSCNPESQSYSLCASAYTTHGFVSADASISFREGFVSSAQNCNVWVSMELKGADGGTWSSEPKRGDCENALFGRTKFHRFEVDDVHDSTNTVAVETRVHACVDLYWGGPSLWHRCWMSDRWLALD